MPSAKGGGRAVGSSCTQRCARTRTSPPDILQRLQAKGIGPRRLHSPKRSLPLRLRPLLLAAQLPHGGLQGGAGGGKGAAAAAGCGVAPGCETLHLRAPVAAGGPAGDRCGTPGAAARQHRDLGLQHCARAALYKLRC